MELLCVPGAGGSARAYRPWAAVLAPEFTVRALDLPGRGQAARETPGTTLVETAAKLVDRIPREGPYALAGHSMGGLLAYEMARRICATDSLPRPEFVVVAGARPPHMISAAEFNRLVTTGDDDLLTGLVALGFVDPTALQSPMRALFVPSLRADLALVAAYEPEPGEPLPVDLFAWYGLADLTAPGTAVEEWARYTGARFATAAFPGGHDFPYERPRAVAERLRAHRASTEDAPTTRRNHVGHDRPHPGPARGLDPAA
jgi:surfactin synthase thioesterase subunit